MVISTALWRRLGGDPGDRRARRSRSTAAAITVTGVMPASFHLPVAGVTSAGLRTDVWMPLDPREQAGGLHRLRDAGSPDVTFAAAEADVKRVAAEIAAEDPVNHPAYTARLFDLRETVIKDIRPTLLLLFARGRAAVPDHLRERRRAAAGALGRAGARNGDPRRAGSRPRAARRAVSSRRALLVSLAGAAGGVFLSVTLTPVIVAMAADYLPRADEIAVDWTVLLFALGAAFVASALSSLAPLWQAARTAPADALGDGVRASAGARSRRVSQSLVVAEIALAFALLAVSAVLIVHLRNLSRVSPGFDADDVLTFVAQRARARSPTIPASAFPCSDGWSRRCRAIPGVDEVAFANQLPLDGCCWARTIYPKAARRMRARRSARA